MFRTLCACGLEIVQIMRGLSHRFDRDFNVSNGIMLCVWIDAPRAHIVRQRNRLIGWPRYVDRNALHKRAHPTAMHRPHDRQLRVPKCEMRRRNRRIIRRMPDDSED